MADNYVSNYERVLNQKALGSGEIVRFHCPFKGCVGYQKKTFCVNIRSGSWCCHHCNQERPDQHYKDGSSGGHGGTAHEFAEMMNDDVSVWPSGILNDIPKAKVNALTGKKRRELFTALFSLSHLSNEHRESIAARGIDPDRAGMVSVPPHLLEHLEEQFDREVILRGGLAYENKDGLLIPRYCIGPDRILIPYLDDGKVYYFVGYAPCPKRRPDQSSEDYQNLRSTWPKIAGPAGYTPAVYGDIPAGAPLLIVTEGQFKAEAARQHGFCCVGLQGIMSSHTSVVKKCVAAQAQRVVILFDTQDHDQDNIDWAAEKLARELLKAEVQPFKAMLPLDPAVENGHKMDIDSFLVHHGVSEFIQVLMQAQPYLIQKGEPNELSTSDPE